MKNVIQIPLFAAFITLSTAGAFADSQPAPEQGEVWGQHEQTIAEKITQQTRAIVDKSKTAEGAHRDAHPKSHGCVKATWTVFNSELNPNQRRDVFTENAAPIQAWVRFSNGDPSGYDAPDSNADARGMAIKLMTPQGSHDFVTMNSARFFSRNADDYADFFDAVTSGGASLVWYFIRNPTNALIANHARAKIDNVLTTTYFSPVPLKLFNQSMRIKVQPCSTNGNPTVDHSHKNFLGESLLTTLSAGEACFDIFVEPNMDPAHNNVEDPSLNWDETVSPFKHAARLDILKQDDFATPERKAFCENLSFNPWHSTPELRPLGQINRIRQVAYDGISKYRHALNNVPEVEPTDHNACQGATAALCKPLGQ